MFHNTTQVTFEVGYFRDLRTTIKFITSVALLSGGRYIDFWTIVDLYANCWPLPSNCSSARARGLVHVGGRLASRRKIKPGGIELFKIFVAWNSRILNQELLIVQLNQSKLFHSEKLSPQFHRHGPNRSTNYRHSASHLIPVKFIITLILSVFLTSQDKNKESVLDSF